MKSDAFQTHSDDELAAHAAVFGALAHPVRLRIVLGLLAGDCCVGSMVECLDLPQALVSRHLAILREAGVVTCEVEGRKRRYRVVNPAIARIAGSLTPNTQESRP